MDYSNLPVAIIALLYVIKLIIDSKKEKKNGSGSSGEERRVADREFKKNIVDRLEAQTLVLTKILDTTESTNGKCARIEKDTTEIKIKVGLGGSD